MKCVLHTKVMVDKSVVRLATVPTDGPPLFQGCSAVYLDFGLNLGLNLERLYEPERFTRRAGSIPKFEPTHSMHRIFGNTSEERAGVCAAGFEPNQVHAPRLRALKRRLAVGGRRVHIFGAAITADASMPNMTYWTDMAAHNRQNGETGNSLLRWAGSMDPAHSVAVPTVHFEWFLRRHLEGARAARVVVKMDVEGSEYSVLPPAIRSGALCHSVDLLLLEKHDRFFKASWRGHNPAFGTDMSGPHALDAALSDIRTGRTADRCRTNLKVVDFP